MARRRPKKNPGISDVILEATARAAFVVSFADRCIDMGLGRQGNWDDIAPDETNPKANAWAEEVWTEIASMNPLGLRSGTTLPEAIAECWDEAVARNNEAEERKQKRRHEYEPVFIDVDDEEAAREFGHYIAMQVMGTGVSWMDDHADHGLKLPHRETPTHDVVDDADIGDILNGDTDLINGITDILGIYDERADEWEAGNEPPEDTRTWELSTAYANEFGGVCVEEATALSQLANNLNSRAYYGQLAGQSQNAWERVAQMAICLSAALQRRLGNEPKENPSRRSKRATSDRLPRARKKSSRRNKRAIGRPPNENPILEYRKHTHPDGFEQKAMTSEVKTSEGRDILNKHLRSAEMHEEGVYIEVETARGQHTRAGDADHIEHSVTAAVFISADRLPFDASLEERAEQAKENAYFIFRDQDDRILVPAGYFRHEKECPWRYADEARLHGPAPLDVLHARPGALLLGKCTCSSATLDAMNNEDAIRAVQVYLFPSRILALDVRYPIRLNGRLMELREAMGGRKIRTAYSITTPESVEYGDVDERGWEDEEGRSMEPDEYDIEEGVEKYGDIATGSRDEGGLRVPTYSTGLSNTSLGAVYLAVKFLKDAGVEEASSHGGGVDTWYIARSQDVHSTNETERTYHLDNFDEEEEKAIYNILFKGRRRNPSRRTAREPSTTRSNPSRRSRATRTRRTNPHPIDHDKCRECGATFVAKEGPFRWRRADVIPFDLDPSICSECGVKNSSLRKGVKEFEETMRETMRATEARDMEDFQSTVRRSKK